MGKHTIVGAKMEFARVLKPPDNFEDTYQGLSAVNVPIAIPGTLDFRAGQRGYDPALMAGIPIPIGTRLLLWLPQPILVEGLPNPEPYEYRIMWRLRTQDDTNEAANRSPPGQVGLVGHLNQALPGVPADNGANPNDQTQERIVIPCALQSILFEQNEPASTFGDVANNLRGERYSVRGQSYSSDGLGEAPLVTGTGNKAIASQGVYPFLGAGLGNAGGPTYLPWMVDAMGDEYILLVTRPAGLNANWDFAGADFGFSRLFGTANGTRNPIPGVGIYALEGSGAT